MDAAAPPILVALTYFVGAIIFFIIKLIESRRKEAKHVKTADDAAPSRRDAITKRLYNSRTKRNL